MSLTCNVEDFDGTPVVRLLGELDMASADELDAAIRSVEKPDVPRIVVDLRGLEFMDSSGLRAVIAADSRARKEGRELELIPGKDSVHRVFRMTLLDDRLRFIDPPDGTGAPDPRGSGEAG